jgi:hypothetical protein
VPLSIEVALPHRMRVRLRLDREWQIRPSRELTAALEGMLGPRAIVYRAGPAPDTPSQGDRRAQWRNRNNARNGPPG